MFTVTLDSAGGDVVEGITKGKIPRTPDERRTRKAMRDLKRALNMACGKRCSKCGSNTAEFQNKAHARALRNAGISKAKCRSCKRWL